MSSKEKQDAKKQEETYQKKKTIKKKKANYFPQFQTDVPPPPTPPPPPHAIPSFPTRLWRAVFVQALSAQQSPNNLPVFSPSIRRAHDKHTWREESPKIKTAFSTSTPPLCSSLEARTSLAASNILTVQIENQIGTMPPTHQTLAKTFNKYEKAEEVIIIFKWRKLILKKTLMK